MYIIVREFKAAGMAGVARVLFCRCGVKLHERPKEATLLLLRNTAKQHTTTSGQPDTVCV